jgi:hypothetical protein
MAQKQANLKIALNNLRLLVPHLGDVKQNFVCSDDSRSRFKRELVTDCSAIESLRETF